MRQHQIGAKFDKAWREKRLPKVAILGTRGYPSHYGGFETAVRVLAPFLADRGWEVTVYGRPGGVDSSAEDTDPRVSSVMTRGIEQKALSTLSYGFTSSRAAIKDRPDVALVMNVANGFWLRSLERAKVPTLMNVDGIEWDRDKWGRLARWIFKKGAIRSSKHATRLVFDAEAIAARWEAEFSATGAFIPYGGTVPGRHLELEPGLVRRKYVLAVARFVPENSIPLFFETVRSMSRDTTFVIVGSSGYGGPLDEEAKRLAAELPSVYWLGHVRDDRRLWSLWQNAGAYFHGHSVGGTNPALVQAMACGAPIVARDTVYNREVLGGSGVFAEPTPWSIAEALTEVLRSSELQERLSASAIQRAQERYSWQYVCESYERELRHLLTT